MFSFRFATLAILLAAVLCASADAAPGEAAPTETQPSDKAAASSAGWLAPPDERPEPALLPDRERLPLGPADANAEAKTQSPQDMGVGSWGLQTAMALGVVIGLIFLLRVFLKRVHGLSQGPAGGIGLVDVLGRTTIGPKTQLVFLKLNHRVIVAGQTPAGISTLASIEDPDEVAAVLAHVQARRDNSISAGFQRLLQQVSTGQGLDENDTGSATPGSDDEQLLHRTRGQLSGVLDRLRGMKGGDDRP